jgi:hypothetical protein
VLSGVAARLILALLLSACSAVVGTPTAAADVPVRCPHGNSYNPRTGKCVITVSPTPHEATRPNTTSEPVNSKSPKRCVSPYSGKEVPCRDGSSWWSNDRGCYVSLADPQPPKSDPEWDPHGVGALPGVRVSAIRARPLAERIRVRCAPLSAGDRGAVTHRPHHALDLRASGHVAVRG